MYRTHTAFQHGLAVQQDIQRAGVRPTATRSGNACVVGGSGAVAVGVGEDPYVKATGNLCQK